MSGFLCDGRATMERVALREAIDAYALMEFKLKKVRRKQAAAVASRAQRRASIPGVGGENINTLRLPHAENVAQDVMKIVQPSSTKLPLVSGKNNLRKRMKKCNFCDARFTTFIDRKAHWHSAHGDKLKCSDLNCDFKVDGGTQKEMKLLIAHEKKAHRNERRPYECKTCKQRFYTYVHRDVHERIHKGHPYFCPAQGCTYSSTKKFNVKIHFLAKHVGKTFSCKKCAYSCATPRLLKNHMQSKHSETLSELAVSSQMTKRNTQTNSFVVLQQGTL